MNLDLLRESLADVAEWSEPADLRDRILRKSRRVGIQRAALGAVAVVVTVGAAAGGALVVAHPTSQNAPTTQITAPVASAPAPSVSTSASASAATAVIPPPDPRTVDLRNATIDIPTWPGNSSFITSGCPAGQRRFTNGSAAANAGQSSIYTLPADLPTGYANLDGEAGDEAVVTLLCSGGGSLNAELLLALKVRPDHTLTTLGSVVTATDNALLAYDDDDVRTDGNRVLVEVWGNYVSNGGYAFKQLRGYKYDNGAFHQVSGPTSTPALPKNVHDVDLRNTTLHLEGLGECNLVCHDVAVRFVDGAGQDTTVTSGNAPNLIHQSYTYTIDQTSYTKIENVDRALVTVTRRATDGSRVQAVFAVAAGFDLFGRGIGGWAVIATGQDGVTGIVSQRGVGDLAEVTVKTANGQQVRTYRLQDNGHQWQRVS
jgi:hypothetical protein